MAQEDSVDLDKFLPEIVPKRDPYNPPSKRHDRAIVAKMRDIVEEEALWAIKDCHISAEKPDATPQERRNWMRLHKDYLDLYGKQASDIIKTEIVQEQIALAGNRTFKPHELVPQILPQTIEINVEPQKEKEANGL